MTSDGGFTIGQRTQDELDAWWDEYNATRCKAMPGPADFEKARGYLPPEATIGRCEIRLDHGKPHDGPHSFLQESTDPDERIASGLPPLPDDFVPLDLLPREPNDIA